MDLFIYFWINNGEFGQFEWILIVVELGSLVMYLEGCIVLMFDINQFYVAVVEFVIFDNVEIKYFIV